MFPKLSPIACWWRKASILFVRPCARSCRYPQAAASFGCFSAFTFSPAPQQWRPCRLGGSVAPGRPAAAALGQGAGRAGG
eukprot:3817185-Pyramimonas_sp.AAC.1